MFLTSNTPGKVPLRIMGLHLLCHTRQESSTPPCTGAVSFIKRSSGPLTLLPLLLLSSSPPCPNNGLSRFDASRPTIRVLQRNTARGAHNNPFCSPRNAAPMADYTTHIQSTNWDLLLLCSPFSLSLSLFSLHQTPHKSIPLPIKQTIF